MRKTLADGILIVYPALLWYAGFGAYLTAGTELKLRKEIPRV